MNKEIKRSKLARVLRKLKIDSIVPFKEKPSDEIHIKLQKTEDDTGSDEKITEEELNDRIRNLNLPNISDKAKEEGELAHEVFFLRRMISGAFENFNENSFGSNIDRQLYNRFNKLSLTEKQKEYKELERKLMQATL